MNINELLDEAKKGEGLTTDTALGKAIGHKIGDISHWRAGGKYRPNLETCYKLGVMAKLKSPWEAVIIVEREAAKKPEKKKFWDDVINNVALVGIIGFVILIMTPSPAFAYEINNLNNNHFHSMYIMSNALIFLYQIFRHFISKLTRDRWFETFSSLPKF